MLSQQIEMRIAKICVAPDISLISKLFSCTERMLVANHNTKCLHLRSWYNPLDFYRIWNKISMYEVNSVVYDVFMFRHNAAGGAPHTN